MKRFLTTLLVTVFCLPLQALANAPVAEVRSLLNARLTTTGNLMFSEFRLFFPPPEPVTGKVELLYNGAVINTREIADRYIQLSDDNVMAKVGVRGIPVQQLTKPGDYQINITINNQLITRFPFTMNKEASNDPFAPQDSFSFTGPWQSLAYLKGKKHRDKMTGKTGEGVSIAFWPGQSDAIDNEGFLVHAYLRKDGEVIGHSKLTVGTKLKVHKNMPMFTYTEHDFYVPHERKDSGTAKRLTFAALPDGNYEITVVHAANQAALRAFSMTLKNGGVVPRERAQLSYEPIADRLVPRTYKLGSTTNEHEPVYWLQDKR